MSHNIQNDIQELFDLQMSQRVLRRTQLGLTERLQALKQLAASIREHQEDIVRALSQDFGKPEPEVLLTEILPVLQEIKHTCRHLKRWMQGTRVSDTLATLGTRADLFREWRSPPSHTGGGGCRPKEV